MFKSILESANYVTEIDITKVLICTAVAIALGFIIAISYMLGGKYSKNIIITLVIIPPLVQCIILMVNGNLGTGIAVAGAFSLIRFRSAPGTAKDIAALLLAVAIGLATGMGYVVYAAIFTVIVCILFVLISKTGFGNVPLTHKSLKITVPEDLNYAEAFEDIFTKYTSSCTLERSKTTNLGSMFDITYSIVLKDVKQEKNMMDEIRTRNGNLTVICGNLKEEKNQL